jgi:hypothetical protein
MLTDEQLQRCQRAIGELWLWAETLPGRRTDDYFSATSSVYSRRRGWRIWNAEAIGINKKILGRSKEYLDRSPSLTPSKRSGGGGAATSQGRPHANASLRRRPLSV